MKTIYNIGSEAIETVYTYEEWLREYNRRAKRRRNRRKTERLYYLKQHLSGVIMVVIGIVMLFLFDGDATFSLIALSLGIFLMLTRKKIMIF